MTTSTQLPRWDMTVVFPGLDSTEFDREFQDIPRRIADFADLLDRYGIGSESGTTDDEAVAATFDRVISAYNELHERLRTLSAYIRSFVATDSFNDLAQARNSELEQCTVRLAKLGTRVTAWLGALDIDQLIQDSSRARELAFALRKMAIQAQHLMSMPEEDLAAELEPSGGSAWGKMKSNIASQLLVTLEMGGTEERVPMSVVRIMAHDANRDVRRQAYEAEIAAWKQVATPIAAALNGIKGESNVLLSRRGWPSPLDFALFNNNIDRTTLDAMFEAARAAFPDFRRYLRTKAHALGLEKLAWYDLYAPMGETEQVWDFADGTAFLLEQFGAYSARLRGFAERAFDEHWIDAEPRSGKVDGAFCMPLRAGESRILSNYVPSYDGVSTLAHELGHGYHNFNLADRSILQRQTPMTLAETASIFCETIIEHAALEHAGREEQIAILESSLQGSCQVVVDITSRFMFEEAVFERRRQRDLSVDELNAIMLDAQRRTYGDGLDETTLHPYMWAAKTHYYSMARPFYNFPYMFGLLFGLGLYAHFQTDPDGFRDRYDEFLSSTGLADAATLAGRFGIDIRTPAFWHSSLDVVRQKIDRFETLIGAS